MDGRELIAISDSNLMANGVDGCVVLPEVGKVIGDAEGLAIGSLDKSTEGVVVGPFEGEATGGSVGALNGGEDGLALGTKIGSLVGFD